MRLSRAGLRSGAHAALLVLGVVTVMGWAAGCRGRPRAAGGMPAGSVSAGRPQEPDPTREHVAELDLTGGAPEVFHGGVLGASSDRSFAELIQRIEQLSRPTEKRVKGIVVRFGTANLGFSRAQELAEALTAFRATGKPVVCHADEFGNASYWAAAAGCDRIWLGPAGGVDNVGIAAQVLYAKRLLGELKVDVDMLQVGKYKGASEPLTRDGPSEEARESLMSVLRSIRGTWLSGIAKRLAPGADGSIAEQGPLAPEEAKGKGLIDEIGYVEDARAEAQAKAGADQVVGRFGPGSRGAAGGALVGIVRVLSGGGSGFGIPHVTVLRAVGGIGMRSSGSPLSDEEGITERQMSRAIDKILKDKSAKAVVIRIDSPGGSALASDLIWKRLMDLRKTRPVIVSVGDMAASGGYYLACSGSRIFAEPASIVGSIGVVGGKLSIGRGLEHVGVHAEIFAASDAPGASARAAYSSPFQPWDQPTRDRVLASMTSVYDLFVRRVAEGRNLPRTRVEQFAEGRIFSGADGLKLGMVDELGGLGKAIAHAKAAGGLDPEAPVRLVGSEGLLQQLVEADEDEAAEEAHARMAPEGWLLRSVAPELPGFVRALSPLVEGEHALVAVPFAFLVR
jgi:protease IV